MSETSDNSFGLSLDDMIASGIRLWMEMDLVIMMVLTLNQVSGKMFCDVIGC